MYLFVGVERNCLLAFKFVEGTMIILLMNKIVMKVYLKWWAKRANSGIHIEPPLM